MSRAERGNTGLKIIVFMGMGTFLFLALVAFGLRQSFKPREEQRVRPGKAKSPFQETRAWEDLEHLVSLGPRPSASPGMEEQQGYIRRRLREAGLAVREFEFDAETPRGTLPMVDLVGMVEGTRAGVIVLSTHYDTHYLPETHFVGANGGGSGAAWLLEMGRVLGPAREGRSVWLAFFDGGDTEERNLPGRGLYGSRHLAESLRASGELESLETLINVDMIGDCYLSVFQDLGAPSWLSEIVWNTAARQGYKGHFSTYKGDVPGGHVPFREAGIPTLGLIDFSYGGSRLDHGRNWHTERDTLEKVSAGSLRAVGDVIYHALPVIEGHLDTTGARNHGH